MVAHAGSGGVSLVIKPRPPLGWKEEVRFIAPWCGTVWLYLPLRGCGTCKEGPASLCKLNIFLANTCSQKKTFRKLACDHTAWCTHAWVPGCKWRIHFLHVLFSESRARYHLCCSFCCHRSTLPACLDTLPHNLHGHPSPYAQWLAF